MNELLEYLKQKLRLFWEFSISKYKRISDYFRTHPKQRKWAIIASAVFGPPLLFLFVVWIEIPSKRALRNIQNQVASEVYSADSVLLGRYYIQDRTEIEYKDISPAVIDALIATEDIRFYEHSGIDFRSLGRVLFKSILMQDESAGGGSTITQQLAKNLFPRKNYWLLSMPINKMREFWTAVRLEDIYPKKKLLTMYLNTIPFADLTFGIEAASKRFFSKNAKYLKPEEAALLIGMLKATHTYNPRLFPDRAKQRRNVVLALMARYEYLAKEKSDSLQQLPLRLKYSKPSFNQGLAPYFREYLKSELTAWCNTHTKKDGSPYNIYTDGLLIYTTIDSKLQRYAEEAVAKQMTEVQRQFFSHWGSEKPWKGKEEIVTEAMRRSPRYLRLKEEGMSEEEIMKVMQTPIPMRVFTWQGDQDVVMRPIDSIRHHLQYLNAGFLAMEPQTGKVKAWVGGIEFDFFQYDHVKESTKRQVGSIFKPIVYAMAVEQNIPPCDFISADRPTYIDDEGVSWTPRNTQNDYEVKYSMRGALAYSVNTVSVKLIQMAGVDKTAALAKRMGINSEIPDVPSIALGSSSISLMEMTAAYSCFANSGIPSPPYSILSIEDMDGKVYTDFKPQVPQTPVVSKESIDIVRSMMQSVVHEGTASRLRWKYGVLNDVAGKTGTTQANADGWFMAVTPKLVVGTWVGADDPRIRFRSTELGQGSNTALPMFGYFMKQVNEDKQYEYLSKATFPPLPYEQQLRLDCDLYELDSVLIDKIKLTIQKEDSLALADTTYIRDESFLEKLYTRKLKMQLRRSMQDSTREEIIKIRE
jgi:penicillin-binding protein 1A